MYFVLPLIVVVVLVALTLINFFSFESMINVFEESTIKTVEDELQNSIDSQNESLDMALSAILVNNDILKSFAERNRDGLYQMTKPIYDSLKEFGVNQLHFHTPDIHSFLRVHTPEKYGDDLSATRETIVEANKTRKKIIALETGATGLGFRVIQPVFYDNQFIGTVEMGITWMRIS